MKSSLLRLNFKSLRSNIFTKSFLLCILFLFTILSIVKAENDDVKSKSTATKSEQSQDATCASMRQVEVVTEEDRDDGRLSILFARRLYFVIKDGKMKFTRDKYASRRMSGKDHSHLKMPIVFE